MSQQVDIGPHIDDSSFAGMPRRVALLAALAIVLDGFDVQIIAFAASALMIFSLTHPLGRSPDEACSRG